MLPVKTEKDKRALALELKYFTPNFLYNYARQNWGERTQLIVAVEEMSELTKEICKYLRDGTMSDNFVKEIADVRIMLEQLECFYDIGPKVVQARQDKLNRLSERLIDSIVVEEKP